MSGGACDMAGEARGTGWQPVVNVVGAGLAGLSCAIRLAMAGVRSRLVSSQPSERAQSVLAEGGINGALDTMGEGDRTEYHFQDTMRAGCDIADAEAVRGLVEGAPDVLLWLDGLGVPFQRKGTVIQQRNFGGQKKKRTAYALSSTGKALMTALIDEARRHEAAGLITRYPHHDFVRLLRGSGSGRAASRCVGVVVRDGITGERLSLMGPVVMATGGLNGLFFGRTTGTTANTADAAATLLSQGVAFSNLEMVQYHPTTLAIPGKRLLVSEAARGEGGRLFVLRGGERWYFMEERHPELGNLMPRDVVSREEYFVTHDPACGSQVFLDCTGLSREVWRRRLPDLRREVTYYTGLDPARDPIPVEPGIHYFMGGIHVDARHRTSVQGLYAAGECCSLYHGANRLGGNSTLGAIYGGMRAAESVAGELPAWGKEAAEAAPWQAADASAGAPPADAAHDELLAATLYDALGVVRDARGLEAGLERLGQLLASADVPRERERILLGEAMLESALFRRESRGAQYRSDCPERSEEFRGTVLATLVGAPGSERIDVRLKRAQSDPS